MNSVALDDRVPTHLEAAAKIYRLFQFIDLMAIERGDPVSAICSGVGFARVEDAD